MKTTYINAESNTEHVAVSNTFQTIANIANSLLIHNTVKEGVIVPEHKYGYITSLDDETDPDGLRIMKSVNGTIDILFVSLISKKTNVKKSSMLTVIKTLTVDRLCTSIRHQKYGKQYTIPKIRQQKLNWYVA